jgi:hypothetical protein
MAAEPHVEAALARIEQDVLDRKRLAVSGNEYVELHRWPLDHLVGGRGISLELLVPRIDRQSIAGDGSERLEGIEHLDVRHLGPE